MGQELDLGDGLWGTTSDVRNYSHVFADPATGQIALFATMKENGKPFVMGGATESREAALGLPIRADRTPSSSAGSIAAEFGRRH